MMTRRENLLEKPWLRRRYENHRRKVIGALPAVDSRPPSSHPHVLLKLKKLQKEEERVEEVIEGNLRLLERTCRIMSSKRMDDRLGPAPSFLRRVGIYLPRDQQQSKRPSTSSLAQFPLLDQLVGERTNISINGQTIIDEKGIRCHACKYYRRQVEDPRFIVTPNKPRILQRTKAIINTDNHGQPRRIKTASSALSSGNYYKHAAVPISSLNKRHTEATLGLEEVMVISTATQKLRKYKSKNESKLKMHLDDDDMTSRDRIVLSNEEVSVTITFPNLTSVKYADSKGKERILRHDICHCAAAFTMPPQI